MGCHEVQGLVQSFALMGSVVACFEDEGGLEPYLDQMIARGYVLNLYQMINAGMSFRVYLPQCTVRSSYTLRLHYGQVLILRGQKHPQRAGRTNQNILRYIIILPLHSQRTQSEARVPC